MAELSLVMPMAGRGSRFARAGIDLPKPLIALAGKPFFWWAAESLRHACPVAERVFVVLAEHIRHFAIDQVILQFYPDARLVVLDQVTSGAAETAMLGIRALKGSGPLAVNDCDHAFLCPDLAPAIERLTQDAAGGLLCFRSQSPAYSYARLGADGTVTGTTEKQPVSPFAIAGCYLFRSPEILSRAMEDYRASCPYDELFISGVMNTLIASGERVTKTNLALHASFGTPEELDRIDLERFRAAFPWDYPR